MQYQLSDYLNVGNKLTHGKYLLKSPVCAILSIFIYFDFNCTI